MNEQAADVVIVGGGLAGLTTAEAEPPGNYSARSW